MLDFREAAVQHGCSLASYRDRLHRILLEIGDSFQQDLFDHLESLDHVQQPNASNRPSSRRSSSPRC